MSSSQDDFTDTSDTELVKLAKAGNAHAFAQLFQRYKIATKHRESPPPPLHKRVPGLSPTVEQVILKALAKKPEMRFKNVLEFATALEEASAY